MTVLDKANAFIGHAEEVDEGYETTMRRNAFVAGWEAGFVEACEITHKFAALVSKMREAQKIYSETFPTGYGCYAPTELESEVDTWIRENYPHLMEN